MQRLRIIALSEHATGKVRWLWEGRIPRGGISLVEGDPEGNKSSLLYDVAARVSTGRPMDGDATGHPPGAVLLLQAEDTMATMRRNLEAAGADLTKILGFDKSLTEMPMLPDDMEFLAAEVERRGVKLLVVDPITAFTTVNINSDQEVRRMTKPLTLLAERADMAVVLVRHLTKSTGANPLYRGAGSIALIGASRSSLLVAVDPGIPERRVLAVAKSSLTGKPPSLSFRPVASGEALVIEFLGHSDYSAAQLLEAARSHSRRELEEAIYVLYSILGDGPLLAIEAKKLANAAGITDRTLRRAKEVLQVGSRRKGFGRGSQFRWILPKQHEIVARLREHDLDMLCDKLFHGDTGENQFPDDPEDSSDRKKNRKREDKPSDDDPGSSSRMG